MIESFPQWLKDQVPTHGTLVWGVRGPNGKSFCLGFEAEYPAAKMEKILGQYDSLRGASFLDNLAPRWSTWMFERGQIRFVERSDGWLLAVMVRTRSEAAVRLNIVSEEFLALQVADSGVS